MRLPDPLPDKECGECTVCCVHLAIDDPDLKKPADIACVHMAPGGGCALHPHHPQTCRAWQCGWRFLGLSAAMRPDRSQILLVPAIGPGPLGQKGGLKVVLTRREGALLANDEFLNLLAKSVLGDIPFYLTCGSADAREVFLNDLVGPAIAGRDKQALIDILLQLFADLSAATSDQLTRRTL